MYNCGPTVYLEQHIGNLRPYILADTLRRVLEVWRYKVRQVINITDVGHLVSDADEGEDKMEVSAALQGRSAQDIAQEYTQDFFASLDLLGVNRSGITFSPATRYIGEQVALVQALKEKGYAYKTSDGIYFDTSKFAGYGKLGGAGAAGHGVARIEENKEKKNSYDFALWKFSKSDAKRQQEWPSPWGTGFPGWHIECTAMIFKLLGRQIDIHTGGVDHIPIHHNNEIAQAEAITGKQYVRYWLHGEFITIEGKKISKSFGNTIYLRNIADRGFSPRALRYLYLTARYSQPMNFTWDAVEGAHQALMRLRRAAWELPEGQPDEVLLRDFYSAIAEDLDTPRALALLWEHIKTTNRATLLQADKILGLGLADEDVPTKLAVLREDLPQEIQKLMAEREEARKAKDFAKSDALRTHIKTAGYDIQDSPEGPTISKK